MGGAVAACAPPLPLVVLPPDGVSTLRYARGPVPPKRRAAALIGFAPFPLPPPPLRRWRRPLGAKACAPAAGFRCAPLCPCCAVSRGSGGGRPLRQAPAIPFFWSGGGWLLRGHSAAVAPFAGLAAGSQGRGACSSGLWPPRRCGGAPLRSSPAPRFWPRGGAILFSLRRVWGLRRLRAALKVYRAARAAQCGCGVHGFAMNPYVSIYPSTAPYYREARVTLPRRQTACEIAALLRSPH